MNRTKIVHQKQAYYCSRAPDTLPTQTYLASSTLTFRPTLPSIEQSMELQVPGEKNAPYNFKEECLIV